MVDGIPGNIECVVFDFADTLCSAHYFALLGEEHERAISKLIFGENSSRWADPWMVGKITATEVADYLAGHLPLSVSEILDGLHEGCRSLGFNPAVWELALDQRHRGRKTALVTGNMEVFTQIVVPSHHLDQMFDAIVNSSDYGEGRKEVLWPIAFSQLGPDYTYANSLLIEDSIRNVERFRVLDGVAHHYTSDRELLRWLSSIQSGTLVD